MKLSILLIESDFLEFLRLRNLPNCPESFQTFLKVVGTTQISFAPSNSQFVQVPVGSCIRLRTQGDYSEILLALQEKPDKSRRTSSCSIV